MEITEVRIKLMEDNSGSNERLQAFCSITFDDMFVIRDLKIIEGTKGFFVAMPSRKLSDRCGHCGTKNHLRSRFCNQCGSRLDESRAIRDAEGRAKLHADIAHPINSSCRELLQAAVLASYADELERSKLPGYMSRYDDFDDGDWDNAMPIPGAYTNYQGQPPQTSPYGNAPFRGSNQAGPPLRRGPLRPHTQHNAPYAPAYRGPHTPRRSPEGDRVIHQENEGYNSHPSDGYGGR